MVKIINGKESANKLKENLKLRITLLKEEGQRTPCLAVILVGDDPASGVYVSNKEKACNRIGLNSFVFHLQSACTEEEILRTIESL